MRGCSNSGTRVSYSWTAMDANGCTTQRTPGSRMPTKRPCLHSNARSDCAIVRRVAMFLPLSSAPKRKNPDRHADQGSGLDLEGTQAFQRYRGKLTARVHTRCNGTQSRAVARLVEENLCHSGRSLLTGFKLSTRKRKKTRQCSEQRARIVFLDVVARVLDPRPFTSREQRRAAR